MTPPESRIIAIDRRPITGAQGLADAGLVSGSDDLAAVEARFAIRIPPHVLETLDGATQGCSLYAQYVPDVRELDERPDERDDPIGDTVFEKVKGITHRYPDRLLLKPTHTCQVYCRFCFRREKVGHPEEALSPGELDAAIGYIAEHEQIFEVILSGGDPLVLSARRIREIAERIGAIGHVAVLRYHTRVPLVAPERVTAELIAALKASGRATFLVLHVNHADELTGAVRAAIARLADAGISLLSQSVLLRGVNDDPDVLAALFRALVGLRVKPYYLHHLDKARGVGHFRVPVARGQAIMAALRGRLSGLCQPTYVLDIPGGHGKVPIGPTYLATGPDGVLRVSDYLGFTHLYPEDEQPEAGA